MIRALMALMVITISMQAVGSQDGAQKSQEWFQMSQNYKKERSLQNQLGWSYVISGGIGFLGGYAGQDIAQDPLEKGAYTLFQSIGIAAVGYGLYKIYIGTEDQKFFSVLESSPLNAEQRESLYRVYLAQKKDLELKENRIRALTHGLIALLNLTNAAQQSPGVVRDSLYFIGGVNFLAAASYSFEF